VTLCIIFITEDCVHIGEINSIWTDKFDMDR